MLAGPALLNLGFLAPGQAAEDRPDLVIAVPTLAGGLEPGMNTGNVDVRVNHSIYDTLIRRNFVAEIENDGLANEPGLAMELIAISPTTYELVLREGVLWHDGTEFGVERVFGEEAPVRQVTQTIGDVASIEAIDRYRVRIVMENPDPIMEHRLSNKGSWIVQKAAYMAFARDDVPVGEWMKQAAEHYNWNPVGTGPYKFESHTPGESIRLVSHDDYFMGIPAARSITFRAVPEVASRVAGLVGGEFDIVADIPPDQVQVFDGYDQINTVDAVLENSQVLIFNTAHPALADKRVRQALSLSIDRQAIVDALWHGKAYTAQGPQLTSFGDMFIEDAPGFEFDPERARALLADAGYDGEEIGFRVIPGYYLLGFEVSQVLQEMWRQVGLNVAIEPVENWSAVRDNTPGIYIWSNTFRFPDPLGQLTLSYGPDSPLQASYGFWKSDAAFDEACRVLETSVDLQERRAAFRVTMATYMEEVPGTFLYNPMLTYAMRDTISYQPSPQYFEDFRPDNLKIIG
jgi:peptide/nickel transport system substrate-binding protein